MRISSAPSSRSTTLRKHSPPLSQKRFSSYLRNLSLTLRNLSYSLSVLTDGDTVMADKSTPKNAPRPTDAELAILRVLWERGPSTVREVHDELSSSQDTGYTTVLKLLQIMTDKGQIGRASCRERVQSSMLAGRVKQSGRSVLAGLCRGDC